MNKEFDICIIVFNSLENDARAFNLINTLQSLDKKLLVISLEKKIFKSIDFTHISIHDKNQKLMKKFINFNLEVYRILKNYQFDYIIASDIYSLLSSSMLKRDYKVKLIYDSREIYSKLASLANKKFKQTFWTVLEKFFISKVNKVIVSGPLDKEYLEDYFIGKKDYSIIYNFPPFKEFKKSNKLREKFNLIENKKVIIYQGMVSEGRGLIESIKAMQYLDCYFVIIGDGNLLPYLNSLVKELNLHHKVLFLGQVPYKDLHEWTCSADLGLALFEPISFSYELALPNKLFEYAMAAVPSIATNLKSIKQVNDKYGLSILVDKIDAKNIANSIENLFNSNKYSLLKKNCIENSQFVSYESQINSIRELINK